MTEDIGSPDSPEDEPEIIEQQVCNNCETSKFDYIGCARTGTLVLRCTVCGILLWLDIFRNGEASK